MLITILGLLGIMFTHFVSDFLFQTHKMSIMKSKSVKWLSYHVGTYALVTMILWFILFPFEMTDGWMWAQVLGITFGTHWITDYFTSKWTSKLYAKGEVHNFFVVIGLDQLIHCTTLFMTYYLMIS